MNRVLEKKLLQFQQQSNISRPEGYELGYRAFSVYD